MLIWPSRQSNPSRRTRMVDHPHLEVLKSRHREIDTRIQEEERRPSPDEAKVAKLKKEKLKLKEEIQDFEATMG
jgi:uncharacterized protein